MSRFSSALRDELIELVRSDESFRDELRRALAGPAADELLTIAAAAAVGSVSAATVSRWIRTGDLAATGRGKCTRIRRADLVAYLERGGRRAVDSRDLSPEEVADLEDGVRR